LLPIDVSAQGTTQVNAFNDPNAFDPKTAVDQYFAAATAAAPPSDTTQDFTPDFLSGSISVPIPSAANLLGVHLGFTVDASGNTYVSLSLVAGLPTAAGYSVMPGWLITNTSAVPSQSQINAVLTQWGAGFSAGGGLGVGLYGNSSGMAVSYGLASPGVSVYGYTWQLPVQLPGWRH
jgi:hypothetical protein